MTNQELHIAVGLIRNDDGEVLIALRPEGADQGGLWEFPGGKVEPGEDVHEALMRELYEELSIRVERVRPLIRIRHSYPEYPVLLDVWCVDDWHGDVHGREGQCIEWVAVKRLPERRFPDANRAIIKALQLPPVYLITPDLNSYGDTFLEQTEQCLRAGINLLQLRCPRLDEVRYSALIKQVRDLCRFYHAQLLVNTGNRGMRLDDADGVQLPARHLLQLGGRPLDDRYCVAASCHNRIEVEHACHLGADFIVIAPVTPTRSHSVPKPLGWDGFRYLSEHSTIPAYALGGMSPGDLPRARAEGAQGIAMISAVWAAPDPAAAVRASVKASRC